MKVFQADTTHQVQQSALPATTTESQEEHYVSIGANGLTPKQTLQLLPKDATPAQQDSAIQANFKPVREHLSDRPDTLRLPFDSVSAVAKDRPFYEESFFETDSMYHPELSGGHFGVAGDPVPYSMRNDNVITGLLLACFILGIIAFSSSRDFILRQAKSFFRVKHGNTTSESETTSEFRFQLFLVFMTCLLLSLLAFFYTEEVINEPLILKSHYLLVAIFLALSIAYFVVKALIYTFVNNVFFDPQSNSTWLRSQLFVTSVEGVLLFPIVILLIYFNLSMNTVLICTAIVVFLIKILSFYKCHVTFFRQNDFILQNFLYFCTLEIMPLFMLLGSVLMIVNNLKINY